MAARAWALSIISWSSSEPTVWDGDRYQEDGSKNTGISRSKPTVWDGDEEGGTMLGGNNNVPSPPCGMAT
jgi:hypothetical protein